ncbi:Putative ubiE/COQ5 methyltransferase, S-adenosyl-L-methionine-dependent methyltransferase [Septoria linicola]|uniref:2-methoxy-6-polyprenyl-1,4-benzoquinol methylase, mitochondrial n=1 Tax=Septoria linicola TaxID=215465 RepID=A0A9Q9ALH8_9PEZI|nr:Putative ubiE/COQ5 methyltransferase, S-adenosyl-L-methionine-dependent methyltransferase [Septoria linicola]
MSTTATRAAKRLRLTNTPSGSNSICATCRRGFAASARQSQQQQQQQQQQQHQTPSPQQSANQNNDNTTHFGFETVAESIKASRVGAVFSSVASNYDTMNDLMSLGVHRVWKDNFVRGLNPGVRYASLQNKGQGQKILDIAGGSGDIAIRMLDHATNINDDHATHVTISDINPDMLNEGRKRLSATPYHTAGRVDYLEANAEDLHTVESNSIDLYTVAFGIRNFTHKEKALREAFRVLKPGGVFACLEFAPQLSNPLLNGLYKRWSFSAIPLIGQIVAADRDSYQYLVESIERFPSQRNWATMIQDAGFLVPGQKSDGTITEAGWEDLSLGIAAIHKGVKPL